MDELLVLSSQPVKDYYHDTLRRNQSVSLSLCASSNSSGSHVYPVSTVLQYTSVHWLGERMDFSKVVLSQMLLPSVEVIITMPPTCWLQNKCFMVLCVLSHVAEIRQQTQLLQCNLIHRVYRLHKINSNYSECCRRCKTETGSLLHMFWTCRCLEQYWRSILDIVKGIVGKEIPANPQLTLLGDLSVLPVNMRVNTCFLRLALIAANKYV